MMDMSSSWQLLDAEVTVTILYTLLNEVKNLPAFSLQIRAKKMPSEYNYEVIVSMNQTPWILFLFYPSFSMTKKLLAD